MTCKSEVQPYLSVIKMVSNKKINDTMSQTDLDRLCFQIKDILRNYGLQQTAEGTMTAEVIMDYLIFIKFFEAYSKELHGEMSLKVYDRMVGQAPYIASMTLKSFMAPYIEKKLATKRNISQDDVSTLLNKEHQLHELLMTTHPTSKIFDNTLSLTGRLKHDECALKILEAIYLSQVKLDDVGDIHEYFIQDEAKSKSKMYGQFFTPNEICMKAMELVQPKLKPDGSIPDCIDPAAGSFKFMRNLAKHLSTTTGKPYEDILLNHCYGCEIEKKAHRSLLFNIVMETGDISDKVYHANSLKYLMYGKLENDNQMQDVDKYDPNMRYDYIFANPPFGCKIELDMLQRDANDKVNTKTKAIGNYKMKTRNSDGMFLQLIIHLLKDGGEACIVMGGSMFNKDWVNVRKHWMETCEIKSITVCPKDSFKNTSIESYLIHFKKGGTTREVKYYHLTEGFISSRNIFDDTCDLSTPKASITSSVVQHQQITLGELCDIVIGYTPDTKNTTFWEGGNVTWFSIKDLADNNKRLITDSSKKITQAAVKQSKMAKKGTVLYGFKLSLGNVAICDVDAFHNEAIAALTIKDVNLMTNDFLYYQMKALDITQYTNTNIYGAQLMNKEILQSIRLVVPPLDVQNAIVNRMLQLDHNINITKQKIEADKEYMKILLETETMGCEKVRLGDVCVIETGDYITKADAIANGEGYDVYGGGNKGTYLSPTYNRENRLVVAKDGVSANCVRFVNGKFHLNHHAWTLRCSSEISEDYLYYHLKAVECEVYNLARGTAQKGISTKAFEQFLITLPPMQKQNKIANECIQIDRNNESQLVQISKLEATKIKVMSQNI